MSISSKSNTKQRASYAHWFKRLVSPVLETSVLEIGLWITIIYLVLRLNSEGMGATAVLLFFCSRLLGYLFD